MFQSEIGTVQQTFMSCITSHFGCVILLNLVMYIHVTTVALIISSNFNIMCVKISPHSQTICCDGFLKHLVMYKAAMLYITPSVS